MSEDLRNHVAVPIALFEAMAEAYYGGGPTRADFLKEREDRFREASEEVQKAKGPPPKPERLEIETVKPNWKPRGVAARSEDGKIPGSRSSEGVV